MSHRDRLRGLSRVAQHIVAAPTAEEAARQLSRRRVAAGDLAWVLWSGSGAPIRAAVAAAGLEVVAAYATLPDSLSPTHLVRTDQPVGRRWFADCVRPTWGTRSRLARFVGRYPVVAPYTFRGRALLLTGSRRPARGWPLSEPGETPSVITLGGGATAGRCLLTFASSTGITRHVKIDPSSRPERLDAESRALGALADLRPVAAAVPQVVAEGHGDDWVALAQSHAPGASLEHRWSTRVGARQRDDDLRRVLTWQAELVEAQLGHPDFVGHLDLRGPVRPTPGSLGEFSDPVALSVTRGLRLAESAEPCLVHGDLWPANVLMSGSDLHVLDWESARIDHPLADALTFLVTATRAARPAESLAQAALAAISAVEGRSPVAEPIHRLIRATTGELGRDELTDLLLGQLFVIFESPAPGGGTDPVRRHDWGEVLTVVGARRNLVPE